MDWYAFDHKDILNSKDFNFGQDCLTKFIKKYKNIVPEYNGQTVKLAQADTQFKELSMLLDICATFQASSADCERGFSLMNAIKSKSRKRLKTDNLDKLMRIKMFITSGSNINLDSVYEYWAKNKDRREKY